MNVLVTGDSGLIGSYIVDACVARGLHVSGISRSQRNTNPNVQRYISDLCNKRETKKLIEGIQPEVIFHCAADAAENKSAFSPITITENGLNTFYNTIVPAINTGKLKRFVFLSSVAVYGAIHVPYKEQDQPQPQDIYGVNKLAAEKALRILSDVHGFEYVIVRPHNVYGPRQNMSDPYRNVVTLFMNQLLKKKPYTIFGDGSMTRCFSYVEDVVKIIVQCGFEDVAGLTINVGSDTQYSLTQLSETIQTLAGTTISPTYEPTRVHEVHTAVPDHTLMNRLFRYANTSLLEGIGHTWEWAKNNGPVTQEYKELEIQSQYVPNVWKR